MKITAEFKLSLALLFTVGVWIGSAPHWSDLSSTTAIGGLFVQLAIVAAAAYGIDIPKKNGN